MAASLEFSVAEIDAATERARESLLVKRNADIQMSRSKRDAGAAIQPAGCPFASQRHLHSRRATKEAAENAAVATLFEETTRELLRSVQNAGFEARADDVDFQAISVDGTALAATCPQPNVTCDPKQRYRQPDGTCNNLRNPGWGSAGSCMQRLLPPAYQDGISAPRVAISGGPLPNARLISSTVHSDMSNPAINFTHMVMQIGQFIDHDFALAPLMPDPGEIVNLGNPNNVIDCCSPSTRNMSECFSIDIPSGDPFFARFNQTCINMPRSAPCSRCNLGYRDQQDILTSYLDNSQVYGSSAADTQRLRSLSRGMLKSQRVSGRELLPRSFHPTMDRCSDPSKNQYCFRAGDERANEHPGLTSIHTVFLREHNRLAGQIGLLRPFYNDEKIFQTAKRIVEATFQHIVYSEWLPVIMGPAEMARYQLVLLRTGFTRYNDSVEATMMNEFAAAAFRLGHTLIDGSFNMPNFFGGGNATLDLKENFFFPFEFYNGQLDPLLRGLVQQPAQTFDKFVTNAVTDHLYRLRNDSFGLDLISLNIQRAREHGVRAYVDYVNLCTGVNITSFDDLLQNIPSSIVDQYRALYADVRDIDLFSAGISERSVPGGVVGPTFACILGHMFQRLRFGDRFWFEHKDQAGSFTSGQLGEIRKTSMARLICDNSDNIRFIQRDVFRPAGPGNPTTTCLTIPSINIFRFL
ncbi:chorion peroxidase-like [Ixodes scapularis]|uniref:chorion peroxidase-like n=1 Tax=Ixodes scapularis TaxID=6945 RepID=UPI001C38AF84|nr:chorion peroxidase-like [Ixodes scapularis]